jgi:hypothetical protein
MSRLKDKHEIPDYEEKAKVLRENGWETWYSDDNWIKTEWIEQGKAYDRMGNSTDRVYALTIKQITTNKLNNSNT